MSTWNIPSGGGRGILWQAGSIHIPPGLIDSAAMLRTGARTDCIHRNFKAGELVRIRRGFYVSASDWLRAFPSERFAWTMAAASRAIPGSVLCRESAALASGISVLRSPKHVEFVANVPGRTGRRPPSMAMLGNSPLSQQVRNTGGYRSDITSVPLPSMRFTANSSARDWFKQLWK